MMIKHFRDFVRSNKLAILRPKDAAIAPPHPLQSTTFTSYTYSRRKQFARLSAGASVLIAGFFTYHSYRAIRVFTLENVKQNALLEVQQDVNDIDAWLAILRDRVETLAQTPTIQNNVQPLDWAAVEPYLQRERGRQEDFFKLALLDAQGYRIGNTAVGIKPEDLSDRKYFRKAMSGYTYSSDAIVSRSTGVVQMTIATPIWPSTSPLEALPTEALPTEAPPANTLSAGADSGQQIPDSTDFGLPVSPAMPARATQPIGVLTGAVKINRVAEILQQLNDGEGSYAFALNSEGQAMIHPDPAQVSTLENPAPSLLESEQADLAEIAQQMSQHNKGIELVSLDGEMRYIAYLPLEEADWSIALVIPRANIESQLRPLDLIIVIVEVLALMVLFILWRVHVGEQAQLERSKTSAEAIAQAESSANRAKSEFLSQISHELRTPLHGILSYAQILQRNPNLNERQVKGLEVIHRSGTHLLTLINDILDFAKIEARKVELTPTKVVLAHLLSHVAEIIQMRAVEKGIVFNRYSDPTLPTLIEVDEKRLRQILINLLGNAVKFTDTGSVTLEVTVLSLQAKTVTLCFKVSDTGIGVKPPHLETIFQPFEQVSHEQSSREGTGLGLAITRQLVEKMGGELQVESEWGQGSTFWFEVSVPVITPKPKSPKPKSPKPKSLKPKSLKPKSLKPKSSKSKSLKPPPPKSAETTHTSAEQVFEDPTVSSHPPVPTLVPPPLEELQMLYELAQFGNRQKIWDYADRLEKLEPQYARFTQEIKAFTTERANQKVLDFIQRFLSRAQHYRGQEC